MNPEDEALLREWHLREQGRRYESGPGALLPEQKVVSARLLGPFLKKMTWHVRQALHEHFNYLHHR